MEGYDHRTYGDRFADVYDDWYGEVTDAAACSATVAELARELAGDRTPVVLELGIGTGRLALPLVAAGMDVRGIDSSEAMVDRLRERPGADDIEVLVRDFADVAMPPRAERAATAADLVLCAYNTFFNLATDAAQQRCLDGVAGVLAPGGRFVLEAFVPPPDVDTVDEREASLVRVRHLSADAVVLSASMRDTDAQTLSGQYVEVREDGIRLRPWHLHYRRPDELDELAAAVGLALEHRWAGWHREPFGGDSRAHVSVYRRGST